MRAHRLRAVAAATGTSLLLTLGAGLTVGAGTASAATGARTATVSTATTARAASAKASVPFKGKSPAAIWALSVAEVRRASGFRAQAHGRLDAGAVADVDVVVGRNGARVSVRSAGWSAQVLRVGSKLWVCGDAGYWRQAGLDAATVKRLAGKWVAVPSSDTAVRLVSTITTAKGWATLLGRIRPTARVAGRTVAKLPTVGLRGGGSTVYVAAKGRPYPLYEVDLDGSATITFSNWNKAVTFKAPTARQLARL